MRLGLETISSTVYMSRHLPIELKASFVLLKPARLPEKCVRREGAEEEQREQR